MTKSDVVFLQTQGAQNELSSFLLKIGFKGEEFADHKKFLVRLKEAPPRFALVNVSGEDMPTLYNTIRIARMLMGPNVPLFAIASPKEPSVDTLARASGATQVIFRPLELDAFLGAIAEHVPASNTQGIEVSRFAAWFFEKLSPALAGLSSVLDLRVDVEAQVRFYESRLMPWQDQFVSMVSLMRKSESKLDLAQCIRMYGLRKTRSLVVAMKISDLVGLPLVGFSPKTGALVGDPAKVLSFSLRTIDHFGEGSRNQVEAFNSGLVIDLLYAMAESLGERKVLFRNFIDEGYTRTIQQADKCVSAGKAVKNLLLERHIITALMMREAGKALLAFFFEDYLSLSKKMERKGLPPVLQHLVEVRKFKISHNLAGALACQGSPGLGDAYNAVLFFDYPYMTSRSPQEADIQDLVRVCNS